MSSELYAPSRGELIWLTYQPAAGHEQSGRRLAIVLSHEIYNRKVGMCIACPITSETKGYPFEVGLPAGLPVKGVILADQIRSVDWRSRQAQSIGHCSQETLTAVLAKVKALIE